MQHQIVHVTRHEHMPFSPNKPGKCSDMQEVGSTAAETRIRFHERMVSDCKAKDLRDHVISREATRELIAWRSGNAAREFSCNTVHVLPICLPPMNSQ